MSRHLRPALLAVCSGLGQYAVTFILFVLGWMDIGLVGEYVLVGVYRLLYAVPILIGVHPVWQDGQKQLQVFAGLKDGPTILVNGLVWGALGWWLGSRRACKDPAHATAGPPPPSP